jgi:Aspartyl protease
MVWHKIMLLTLRDNLLLVSVTVAYQGISTNIHNVIIDTGSAATLFSINHLEKIGITPAPHDTLHRIHGIGGTEVVFVRCVDYLRVGKCKLVGFEIEVGSMNYGFDIDGILGMDFLIQAGAIINLWELAITFNTESNNSK